MIAPDKLVIASKLTGKPCADKNGTFVYWLGNDEDSKEPLSNDLLIAIDVEYAHLQAEYDAKQYQRDRAKEYPTLQEQLDMQYWDSVNGTTTWQDAINAVKAKYPKGA